MEDGEVDMTTMKDKVDIIENEKTSSDCSLCGSCDEVIHTKSQVEKHIDGYNIHHWFGGLKTK